MLNMSVGEVIKLVDAMGVDEKAIVELVKTLRDAFKQWVRHVLTKVDNLYIFFTSPVA